jgi:hypothetical protein
LPTSAIAPSGTTHTGVFETERVFGTTLLLSGGRVIPVRWVGEQHVREDLGRIPSLADWLRRIAPEPWMTRSRRLSEEIENLPIPAEPERHAVIDGAAALREPGGSAVCCIEASEGGPRRSPEPIPSSTATECPNAYPPDPSPPRT